MSCNHHHDNGQPHPHCEPPRDDDDLVLPTLGCPACGERRVDYLAWIDDDVVRCTTCDVEYEPSASAPPPEGGDDAAGR